MWKLCAREPYPEDFIQNIWWHDPKKLYIVSFLYVNRWEIFGSANYWNSANWLDYPNMKRFYNYIYIYWKVGIANFYWIMKMLKPCNIVAVKDGISNLGFYCSLFRRLIWILICAYSHCTLRRFKNGCNWHKTFNKHFSLELTIVHWFSYYTFGCFWINCLFSFIIK